MAKMTEIIVSYKRVHNLGNYSSVHVEATATVEIEDGDDTDAVAEDARKFCREQVKAELLRLAGTQRAYVQELFQGLPVDMQREIIEASQEKF